MCSRMRAKLSVYTTLDTSKKEVFNIQFPSTLSQPACGFNVFFFNMFNSYLRKWFQFDAHVSGRGWNHQCRYFMIIQETSMLNWGQWSRHVHPRKLTGWKPGIFFRFQPLILRQGFTLVGEKEGLDTPFLLSPKFVDTPYPSVEKPRVFPWLKKGDLRP